MMGWRSVVLVGVGIAGTGCEIIFNSDFSCQTTADCPTAGQTCVQNRCVGGGTGDAGSQDAGTNLHDAGQDGSSQPGNDSGTSDSGQVDSGGGIPDAGPPNVYLVAVSSDVPGVVQGQTGVWVRVFLTNTDPVSPATLTSITPTFSSNGTAVNGDFSVMAQTNLVLPPNGQAAYVFSVQVKSSAGAGAVRVDASVQGMLNGKPVALTVAERPLNWTVFALPAASFSPSTGPGTLSGCGEVGYTLTQSAGARVDVRIQFSPAADGGLPFQNASMGRGDQGIYGVLASAQGRPGKFVWDTLTDLGRPSQTVVLQISAGMFGVWSTPSAVQVTASNPTTRPFACVPDFAARRDFSGTGIVAPSGLVAADLYTDGGLELVVVNGENNGANSVVVLPGNGSGFFSGTAAETLNLTSDTPYQVLATNLSGTDGGPLDLVVANTGTLSGSGNVEIFRATTPGVFGSPTLLTPGMGPAAIDVGRFNESSVYPDLAIADSTAGNVAVYQGSATGFGSPTTFKSDPVSGPLPEGVAHADFNNDGHQDLVVANDNANDVDLFLGTGTGTFTTPGTQIALSTGSDPGTIIAQDLNGDGNADFAIDALSIGQIQVYYGTGTGSFSAPTEISVGLNSASTPYIIAVGDLNGDGKPDLVTTNFGDGTVSVALATANGFQSATTFASGDSPWTVVIADVDYDGNLDLVTTNFGSNNNEYSVSAFMGLGDGTFALPADHLVAAGGGVQPTRLKVGDLNKDGIPDVVVANSGNNTLTVLLGTSSAILGAPQTLSLPATSTAPLAVAIADFNGDGNLDVASANHGSGDVTVFLGNGSGGFSTGTSYPAGPNPTGIVARDINGDGWSDIVVSNDDLCGTAAGASVLLGEGTGTFGIPTPIASPNSDAIVSADLNNDGWPDLILIDSGDDQINVLLATGNGGYGAPITTTTGSEPTAVTVGDLDGDTVPDLVISNFMDGTVSVYLGSSFSTSTGYGSPTAYPSGDGADATAIVDTNGDGIPDIVVTNQNAADFTVLLGDGHGAFHLGGKYGVGRVDWSPQPTDLAILDLNGDGKPDITCANFHVDKVSVLLAR
jgi:hypothetical protein